MRAAPTSSERATCVYGSSELCRPPGNAGSDSRPSVTLRDRMHVVIGGGGVAALETLLAVRALAGHLVDITVISPARESCTAP